jgi:hypothetical protein
MRFRFTAIVKGLELHNPPDGKVQLVTRGAHEVVVTLRPLPKREQRRQGRWGVRCEAMTSFEPKNPLVLEGFQALAREELPEAVEGEPDWWTDGKLINRNFLALLPKPMQTLIDQTGKELEDAAERAVEVTRWRNGAEGPHQPFGYRERHWALKGRQWRHMPVEIFVKVTSHVIPQFSSELVAEIQNLLDRGVQPPLARSLFREAAEQRSSNPRSSLVIAVAALEVGIKQHLSGLVPELDWWLDEAPAPPILKLLTDYLPRLGGPTLDSKVAEQLDKTIKARNRIVHTGVEGKLKGDRLEKALDAIDDTLWWLDAIGGQSWATRWTGLPVKS